MAAPLDTVFGLFAKEEKKCEEADVGTIVRSQGLSPTNAQLEAAMSAAGIQGQADYKQVQAVAKALGNTQRNDLGSDLKSAFSAFDSQQDGSVSITEMTHVLTHMGEKLSEEQVNEVLHAYSSNCTDSMGGLDYAKFSNTAAQGVDAAV